LDAGNVGAWGRIALPVAIAVGQPLMFREWLPNAPMARELWKIPYPAEGAEVVPTVCWHRCLGSIRTASPSATAEDSSTGLWPAFPLVIGVGYPSALIGTIFPQPNDIPMDWIVTGTTPPLPRRRQS
jgi:5-formyltetrahydrofolate cyclo-ligase